MKNLVEIISVIFIHNIYIIHLGYIKYYAEIDVRLTDNS